VNDPYEVKTDGRTVSITRRDACLARISEFLGELFPTPDTSEKFLPADWTRWVARLQELHGITLDEGHRPRWAR
jgi:hypothetical protein